MRKNVLTIGKLKCGLLLKMKKLNFSHLILNILLFLLTIFQIEAQTVTCPAFTDLGTFNCTNIEDVPDKPGNLEEAMAAPYSIGITGASNLTSVATDDSDIIFYCEGNAREVIREVIIYNDDNLNFQYDLGEDIATCSYTIYTVPDVQAPSFTAPTEFTTTCPYEPQILGIETVISDDDCPVDNMSDYVNFSYDERPGKCPGERIVFRSWIATDPCGNTSEPQTQQFIIQDVTGPEFTVPADITLTCGNDILNENITGFVTDGYDICEGTDIIVDSRIIADLTKFNTPFAGATTYTKRWAAVDGCNNTTIKDQLIIVECLTVTILGCTDPTSTRYNADATLDDGSCFSFPGLCPLETNLGIFDCNNIEDVPPPVNTMVDAIEVYGIETTGDSSLGRVVSIDSDLISLGIEDARVINRSIIVYEDNNSNFSYDSGEEISICDFIINTIADVTPPSFIVPSITATDCSLGYQPDTISDLTVVADDDCPTDYESEYVFFADAVAEGSCNSELIITRSWAAIDAFGNAGTQTQIITIKDESVPEFTVPDNIVLPCGTDPMDECDQTELMVNSIIVTDLTLEDTPCVGATTYTRRWGAVDDCGNVTTKDQIIIVNSCEGCITGCHLDDWTALKALYESTDGDNWINNAGWEQLNGEVPTEDCNLAALYGVSLNEEGRVDSITLVNNQLNGSLPAALCTLSELGSLNLGENKLNGDIPAELCGLTNLTDLSLNDNDLTGNLPSGLGDLINLIILNLSENQFDGSPSNQIKDLINLTYINLSNNQFTGVILPDISNFLLELEFIDLSQNAFIGEIPLSIDNLTNLSVFNLSDNVFSGEIPSNVGNLSILDILNLSINEFSGNIPDALGSLSNLTIMNLSVNEFDGSIPSSFSNLTNLIGLLLNHNQLTGSVQSILALEGKINISNNNFVCLQIPDDSTIIYDEQNFRPANYEDIKVNLFYADSLDPSLDINIEMEDTVGFTYQWLRNGELLDGFNQNSLKFEEITSENVGRYIFIAINNNCLKNNVPVKLVSDPIYVILEGLSLVGEPVEYDQLIVEFSEKVPKHDFQTEILMQNDGYRIDLYNCKKKLELWQFSSSADAVNALVALDQKVTVPKQKNEMLGGFNVKLNMDLPEIGETAYTIINTVDYLNFSDSVSIYILDSGLDEQNYDPESYMFNEAPISSCCNLSSSGYSYTENIQTTNENCTVTENYTDPLGHGTFGFRSIADNFPQNSKIKIVPIQITKSKNEGTLFDLLCGMHHSIDNNADIINISAGFNSESNEFFERAVIKANEEKIIIVAASGNKNTDVDETPQYPAYYSSQYHLVQSFDDLDNLIAEDTIWFDHVISVASINAEKERSDFSNYGRNSVTLAAPGENIYGFGLNGEAEIYSGTSMATFFTSLALALEISVDNSRDYKEVWQAFENNFLEYNEEMANFTKTGKVLKFTFEPVDSIVGCMDCEACNYNPFAAIEGNCNFCSPISNEKLCQDAEEKYCPPCQPTYTCQFAKAIYPWLSNYTSTDDCTEIIDYYDGSYWNYVYIKSENKGELYLDYNGVPMYYGSDNGDRSFPKDFGLSIIDDEWSCNCGIINKQILTPVRKEKS